MKLNEVEYNIDGKPYVGFLADGSNGRKVPGIVVAHEGGGMTGHPKERAKMLAQLGYVAFAMDTFGEKITSREQAMSTIMGLMSDLPTLRKRGQTALGIVKAQPNVDPKRTAAIGFCFGGTTVLELARSGAELNGVVSFHGGLDSPAPADGKNIKCKVLACHGADDPFVPAKDLTAFESEMRDSKVDWQLISYGGAVHSFTQPMAGNDNSKGAAYNEAADRRSWEAMKQFLAELFR